VQEGELPFPLFQYACVPHNYVRRAAVKTEKELEQEAYELEAAQAAEDAKRKAKESTYSSIMSFFGVSSSVDVPNESHKALLPLETVDMQSPVLSVPVPSAFRHLTCVSSTKMTAQLVPEEYVGCESAYVSYEEALPELRRLHRAEECKAMVHRVKGEGRGDGYGLEEAGGVGDGGGGGGGRLQLQRQVRFKAAEFSIQEYYEEKGVYYSRTRSERSESTSTGGSTLAGLAIPSSDRDNVPPVSPAAAGMRTISRVASTPCDMIGQETLKRIVNKFARSVTCIGIPGFVIKSRRVLTPPAAAAAGKTKNNSSSSSLLLTRGLSSGVGGSKSVSSSAIPPISQKVFINVLHHKVVDDLVYSGLVQVAPHEEPLTCVGDSFIALDKDGSKVVVYNVLVASSYIKQSFRRYEKKITTRPFVVSVSIDAVLLLRVEVYCIYVLFHLLLLPFNFFARLLFWDGFRLSTP
jgi:hypothetical protein